MQLSTISEKGQTTIPKSIRDFLDVEPQDKIQYSLENGRVYIEPAALKPLAALEGIFFDDTKPPLGEKDMRDIIDREKHNRMKAKENREIF